MVKLYIKSGQAVQIPLYCFSDPLLCHSNIGQLDVRGGVRMVLYSADQN